MPHYYLGLDLGGTRIRALVIEDAGAEPLVRGRDERPTPSRGGADVVTALADSAQAAMRAASIAVRDVVAVGCVAPGPLDPLTGVVHQTQNIDGFTQFPLRERLAAALGGPPVFVDRDTVAAAIAEKLAGAARTAEHFVYVTVSTGVGGAVVTGGRVVRGVSGTAGEIGHQAVNLDPADSPACRCGSSGCVEAFAAGRNMAERYGVERAEEVFAAAERGDARAGQVVATAALALGALAIGLVNVLNPELIVVGGAVAKGQPEHVLGAMRRHAAERAFRTPAAAVRIVPAALGSDVGTIGAALEARERAAGRDAWFL